MGLDSVPGVGGRGRGTSAFLTFLALFPLLLTTLLHPAMAQERWALLADPVFRRYTQDDGLPNPVCAALAEDADGFIWIGTEGGLARWDGYQFRTYRPNPDDPGALRDISIQALHTDARGRLWIGTSAAGLARYDRIHDRFITYPSGPGGISNINILAIADGGDGTLWIGSDRGLDHLDPDTGKVTSERHVPEQADSLPDNQVIAIARDEGGTLWVGTGKGLVRRPAGAKGFVAVPLEGAPADTPIAALFEDEEGRIWIGTNSHGAYVVGPTQSLPHAIHETSPTGDALRNEWIYTIAAAEPGKIWLGTFLHGIVSVDVASGETSRIHNDPFLPRTLSNDAIWALHRDRSGIMWVGTTDGLSRQDSLSGALLTAYGAGTKANRISEGDIMSLLPTSDGHVWLGLRSKGVDIVDPIAGHLKTIASELNATDRALPRAFVTAMAELEGRQVYLGSYRGLYRTDLQGEAVSRLAPRGRDPQAGITTLLGVAGKLWVGGVDDGLWAMTPGHETDMSPEHFGADVLTDARVTTLAAEPNHALWIGTRNGLNRLDLATRQVERIPPAPAAPGGLAAGYIASLLVDQAGRLWVAMQGGGVDVMVGRSNGKPVFHNIGTADGLPDANIDSLLADRRGRIWAATDNGLAVIDPDNFTVHALRRADGVAVSAYWAGSGAATSQGELLFGGLGAMTVIRPERFQPWDYQPPIVVTDLRVANKSLPPNLYGESDAQGPIVVPAGGNSLSVEFAALDFSAPEQNRYSYWLEGFDRGWIDTGPARRLAAYTNLPPGSYTLHLRGSNRAGTWSHTGLNLPIIVEPAWFQTIWFRLAEAIIVISSAVAVVQRRTTYLRRRQRDLERQVAERTAELERSKRQIEQIAYQDSLTGLPNRRMFIADFQKHLVLESRRAGRFVLLLIDLDRFKQINDTLGHDAGDAMLVECALRLRAATRHSDCLARLGGDEFAILLTETVDTAAAEAICMRITESFTAPIPFNNIMMTTSASIGIALYPAHGTTQDALYKAADIALYEAKAAGRNTWRWYDPASTDVGEFRTLQPMK